MHEPSCVQADEPLEFCNSTLTKAPDPDGRPRASSDTFTDEPTAGARGAPESPWVPLSVPINCGAVNDTVTGAMAGTPTPGTNSCSEMGDPTEMEVVVLAGAVTLHGI